MPQQNTNVTYTDKANSLYEGQKSQTIVTTRCMTYGGQSDGSEQGVTYRSKHQAVYNCYGLSLVYGNHYLNDRVPTNKIIVKATVEVGSTFYPITWNGSDTVTVSPTAIVESDKLGIELAKDQMFFVRTYVSVENLGEKWPTGLSCLAQNQEGKNAGDVTTGAFTVAADAFGFTPIAIMGYPNSTTEKILCFAHWGDSISVGTGMPNAFTGNGGIGGNLGFMQLAINREYGYAMLGVNGQRATDSTPDGRKSRMIISDKCTHAIVEYGTNDLANAATLATIQAALISLWTSLRNHGLKVYQTTIVPRTTSTDGWTTTTNQTPLNASTAGGPNSTRSQLNDWIRSKPSILTGVFEVADRVETFRNSGIWKPGYTSDGVHPNQTGHIECSKELLNSIFESTLNV